MGESSELVTLHSLDHYRILVGGLWRSFTKQQEVDFDLHWGGLSVRAHRLIVQIFLRPEMLGRTGQSVVDQQADGTNVVSLLEFMYNGRVTVPVQQLPALLALARELDFQMLVDVLQRHVHQSAGERMDRSRENLESSSTHRTSPESVAVVSSGGRRKRKGKAIKLLMRADTGSSDLERDLVHRNQSPDNKNSQSPDGIISYELRPRIPKTKVENVDTVGLRSSEEAGDVNSNFEMDPSEFEASVSDPGKDLSDKLAEDGGTSKTKRRRRKPTDVKPPKKMGRPKEFLRCEHCDYETERLGELKVHQAKHDPSISIFPCTSCTRQFLCPEALDRHVCKNAGEQPPLFECHLCDYTSPRKLYYINHIAKHDPDVKIYKCPDCTSRYYTAAKLDEHVQSKHVKSYSCTLCDFVTQKTWSFSHHLFSRHQLNRKGEKVDALRCPECSFTCQIESQLRYHVEGKHYGYRNFKCEQCSFAGAVKAELTRHIRTVHLNIRPYACSVCSFATHRNYLYKEHMIKHTNQKPYKCHICAKLFAKKCSLAFHVRCHTSDEKKNICEVCGHSFNKRYNLTVHLKNVHKIESGCAAPIK